MSALRFRTSHVAASGCSTVAFFALFALIGLLVSVGLLVAALNETDSSDWVPTPGVVRSLKIEAGDDPFPPYSPVVTYRYDFDGTSHVSDRYAAYAKQFEDYGEAMRALRRYVVGGPVTCYVNPTRPSEAVLQPGRSPMIWFALLPLLFVAVGVTGLYFTLRRRDGVGRRAKSTLTSRGHGHLVGIIIFGAFVLVGTVVLAAFGLPSLREWLSSRSWPAVEATVVGSRVRTHSDGESTTYSVQVVYEYRIGDQTLRANRDGLLSGSSSGRESKERRVREMPPGAKVTAYVDPREPTNSLLDRSGWWLLLSVGVPGVFALVGAGGLYHLLRQRLDEPPTIGAPVPQRSYAPTSAGVATAAPTPAGVTVGGEDAQSLELRATGRRGTLIFLVLFALIWNGATWGFILGVGVGDSCTLLFMVPFVLAGIGVVVAAIHQLLALFNPRAVLVLTPGTLRLGDSFQLDYRFEGRFDRITALKIILEGREEATYTRGTKRTTDKQAFREIELLQTDARVHIERGTIRARMPEDTMHSLLAGDSRIAWRLVVRGTIERWPDVDDEFPVSVLPARLQQGSASWLR